MTLARDGDPQAGPQRRWVLGEIEKMSDADVDRRLQEHAGFDHKGVWRRCIQDIHFCVDDYGPPIYPVMR